MLERSELNCLNNKTLKDNITSSAIFFISTCIFMGIISFLGHWIILICHQVLSIESSHVYSAPFEDHVEMKGKHASGCQAFFAST